VLRASLPLQPLGIPSLSAALELARIRGAHLRAVGLVRNLLLVQRASQLLQLLLLLRHELRV